MGRVISILVFLAGWLICLFVENLISGPHSDCTSSHSWQWRGFFSIFLTHVLLFVFVNTDILTGMTWNFKIVITCISLTVNNVYHFFSSIDFIGHLWFSIWELFIHLIRTFFSTNWFGHLVFKLWSSLYILHINPLSDIWMYKGFFFSMSAFPSFWYLFSLSMWKLPNSGRLVCQFLGVFLF